MADDTPPGNGASTVTKPEPRQEKPNADPPPRARSHFFVQEHPAGELYFSPIPPDTVPPTDQIDLQRKFDDTRAALRAAITDDAKYRQEFARLLGYASSVFNGQVAFVDAGQEWLDDIDRDLILRAGPEFKDRYLKAYAKWALRFSVSILLVSISIRWLLVWAGNTGFLNEVQGKTTVLSTIVIDNKIAPVHLGVVMASAMWGIWLARFWSASTLTLQQLSGGMEPDMFRPWSRLLGSGLAAFLATLILLTGVVQLRIGEYFATDMTNNLIVSVLVGLTLGCLDKLLPDFVQRPLEAMLGSAARAAAVGRQTAPKVGAAKETRS